MVEDAARGLSEATVRTAKANLEAAGVRVIRSTDVANAVAGASLEEALRAAKEVSVAKGVSTRVDALEWGGGHKVKAATKQSEERVWVDRAASEKLPMNAPLMRMQALATGVCVATLMIVGGLIHMWSSVSR